MLLALLLLLFRREIEHFFLLGVKILDQHLISHLTVPTRPLASTKYQRTVILLIMPTLHQMWLMFTKDFSLFCKLWLMRFVTSFKTDTVGLAFLLNLFFPARLLFLSLLMNFLWQWNPVVSNFHPLGKLSRTDACLLNQLNLRLKHIINFRTASQHPLCLWIFIVNWKYSDINVWKVILFLLLANGRCNFQCHRFSISVNCLFEAVFKFGWVPISLVPYFTLH